MVQEVFQRIAKLGGRYARRRAHGSPPFYTSSDCPLGPVRMALDPHRQRSFWLLPASERLVIKIAPSACGPPWPASLGSVTEIIGSHRPLYSSSRNEDW